MNFFQSVFSEDPQPTDLKTHDHDSSSSSSESPTQEIPLVQDQSDPDPDPSSTGHNNTWSFGGLMKTLTTKSESVIQTYKRDLEEFSTGLKNETVAIREVAKEIPVSIKAGASVAQGSLESVWRGTSEIISQGKHVLLPADYGTNSSSNNNNNNSNVRNSRTYGSRFEANVCAIQNDIDSYAEEVSDLDEFEKWKLGFDSQDRGEEIESLLDENNVMEGIYSKLVPSVIDSETFWARYFFRVYKLQQVEDARASLVKRAISVDDEEDLSWDVDDDDEGSSRSEPKGVDSLVAREDLEEKEIQRFPSENDVVESKNVEELQVENSGVVGSKSENEAPVVEIENEEKSGTESDEKVIVEGANESAKTSGRENDNISGTKSDEKVMVEGTDESGKTSGRENDNISGTKSDEKVIVGGTDESGKTSGRENDNKSGTKSDEKVTVEGTNESAKTSDLSGVSGQVVVSEEEDLSWDEIEDVGSGDEKKPTSSGSPNRTELRKRLSTADEDEDLSWDIE